MNPFPQQPKSGETQKMLIIRLAGTAKVIFALFATLCQTQGNITLKELSETKR